MADRPHDLVIYGVTGFAGRLVAEYVRDHAPPGLRWAIAGRSPEKLAPIAEALGGVPTLRADSADAASLSALAASARVVATTVGPYAQHGLPLVAAAVAHGTHYADLTGEPQFVARSIAAHHDAARAAGSRIVHCCGFDSVPSDLGTFLLQQTAIAAHGAPCDRAELVLMKARGGFSGGTFASLIGLVAESADPEVRRVLADPYSLAPGSAGPDPGEQRGVVWREGAGAWTAPFLMAPINERVVRRSNALLAHRYGADFRYTESTRVGKGPLGFLGAAAFAATMATGEPLLRLGPVRRLAMRFLPKPGEGPSPELIATGFFDARIVGYREGQRVAQVDVHGDRDPGYGATACMLGEAALALAFDDGLGEPGVSTPAAALGQRLIDRLNARLVHFRASSS